MVYNLTEDLCYFVDKGIYEQKMAIENMVFILSKHAEDKDEQFFNSKIFKKLHEKTIEKTAARWYRENETIKLFTCEAIKKYSFNLAHSILSVETK